MKMLRLPEEIRSMIYPQLLPLLVYLDVGPNTPKRLQIDDLENLLSGKDTSFRAKINRCLWRTENATYTTQSGSDRPTPNEPCLHATVSLMRTCWTIYRELGPMLYETITISAVDIREACVFGAQLNNTFAGSIRNLECKKTDFIGVEKQDLRRWLCALVKCLSGLTWLEMREFPPTEDAAQTGSRWKSEDLEGMRALLNESRSLSRATIGNWSTETPANMFTNPLELSRCYLKKYEVKVHAEVQRREAENRYLRRLRRSCLLHQGMW